MPPYAQPLEKVDSCNRTKDYRNINVFNQTNSLNSSQANLSRYTSKGRP